MSGFINFKTKLQEHFEEMQRGADYLFEVDLDKDELWNTYLNSFPEGTNKLFRERTEHDCSCCRQFIRNIGTAVFIKDNTMYTIWDLDLDGDSTYQPVCDTLNEYVRAHSVSDIYLSYTKKVGCDHNFEETDGKVYKWDHFYLELPDKFVARANDISQAKANVRDTRNVFKRSLLEISMDAIDIVLELIASNTLYKGEEWKAALAAFKNYKTEYDGLETQLEADLYTWEQAVKIGPVIGRIRNHSIGTLLVNISEGMDLDTAVKKYEQIVAPSNYKRPKAIYTKKMLEDAQKTITELGYLESLPRRFATLDDITVNNILFSNKDSAKRIVDVIDIFEDMKKDVVINPKKFSKVEEISVQNFIYNVLPTAREIEAFVENKHTKNFVSMIAPVNPDAKNMFKWDNPLSWAYTGNITDSDMKQNVKAAGGNVDGVLRFSIQWNEDGLDNCDLDAHCLEPNHQEIYFATYKAPKVSELGGQLDVDIIHPEGKLAVENIVWADKSRMKPGEYVFAVRQFSGSVRKGFRAEIEFDGEIHQFNYPKSMRTNQMVVVARILMDEDGNFSIKESLDGTTNVVSNDIWGVKTNRFNPVSVISYSPNYFNEQSGIGHRHLFFFLKDCVNPEEPHGFYNEFLKNELSEHKRVFEALGGRCHVENTDDQLSGIGFSMTKRADLIVKVKGATERIMKIKF